jgi:hypothetical protein
VHYSGAFRAGNVQRHHAHLSEVDPARLDKKEEADLQRNSLQIRFFLQR